MPLCTGKIADARGRDPRTRPRVATNVAARADRVSPRTVRRYTKRGELEAEAQGQCVNCEWPVPIDSPHAESVARTEPAQDPRDGRGCVDTFDRRR